MPDLCLPFGERGAHGVFQVVVITHEGDEHLQVLEENNHRPLSSFQFLFLGLIGIGRRKGMSHAAAQLNMAVTLLAKLQCSRAGGAADHRGNGRLGEGGRIFHEFRIYQVGIE